MIIREAIAQGSADLKFAGIKTPGLDASLLLAYILKTTRTVLIAAGTDSLSEKASAEYCNLIERRCNGECVAYIIGKKEFRGLEFEVNPSVLVPRPDTEILVETAFYQLTINNEQLAIKRGKFKAGNGNKDRVRVLELCTGSGAVAIALKNEMPELEVYATDISAEALEIAKKNAERLLPGNDIRFYHGDLYNALPNSLLIAHCSEPKVRLLIANPPYIPTHEIDTLSPEVQTEPRIALDGGIDGLDIIRRIISGAPEYLMKGGMLLMEADPHQMNDITILLEKRGFKDIQLYKDLSDSERVIGGTYYE